LPLLIDAAMARRPARRHAIDFRLAIITINSCLAIDTMPWPLFSTLEALQHMRRQARGSRDAGAAAPLSPLRR